MYTGAPRLSNVTDEAQDAAQDAAMIVPGKMLMERSARQAIAHVANIFRYFANLHVDDHLSNTTTTPRTPPPPPSHLLDGIRPLLTNTDAY